METNAAQGIGAAPAGSPTVPLRIHLDRAAGLLDLEWQDGHATRYDAVTLRWLCPCAFCRGEAGLPGWLDTGPTLTADQTRLVDLHLIGSYALAPEWGDGHHTGYYPFVLLRDRCPCGDRRAHPTAAMPAATRPTEVHP
ncbi:MAG TPA: gamma-butyrobetaine hydroxylase-like domain-containing protein [Candidatus Limnocylindrales bacterium]